MSEALGVSLPRAALAALSATQSTTRAMLEDLLREQSSGSPSALFSACQDFFVIIFH